MLIKRVLFLLPIKLEGIWPLFRLSNTFKSRLYRFYARKALKPDFSCRPLKELQGRLKQEGYHSQYGQDKWLNETLLPNKKSGVFCEIGAYDGLTFSNTYFLEKSLNWTGLAIEPVPEAYAKLKANRNCQTIKGCVAANNGKALFLEVSGYPKMLSCLVDSCEEEQLGRIWEEIATHGGALRQIEVEVFNINDLLAAEGLHKIDYMSIDVEGAEFEIVKCLDFDKFDISIISLENNYYDCRVPVHLRKKGYILHSIVGDAFYLKKHLASGIPKGLAVV